jgi:hypothetical protein
MTTIAKFVFVGYAFAFCAASAYAQDDAGAASGALSPPLSQFDRMQAREAARAAEIRKQWLAGHTMAPSLEPTITGGNILTSKLNAARQPAAPEYSVTFNTGPSGLSSVEAYFYSPGEKQYIYVAYGAPNPAPPLTSGTLKILQPGNSYTDGMFSPYSVPGTWQLEDLYIYDRASNYTRYTQQQVAALFPGTSIALTNNGKPDGVDPVIAAGKILTPTVKLSSTYPFFRTELTVSDNLSGVHDVGVWIQPPGGGNYMSGYNDPPAPVKSGKLVVYNDLGTSPKTGTWTITELEICDVAGNCVQDYDASDIQSLFGTTTFKVRN